MTRQMVGVQESRAVAEAARETEWRKPSFAKELFLGRLRLDLIHPHPRPTPQDKDKGEAFLARLRAFLETEVDAAAIEREARVPDELIKGFKELEVMGMQVPEEYGGLGLSKLYYTRALQLSARPNRSSVTCHGAHVRTSARSCSLSPMSEATRRGCGLPRCRPRTGRPTSSTASSCGVPTA